MHFLGARGLKTSSYTVYDYTTSGHMDLLSTLQFYSTYTFLYNLFIYLFLMQ